MKFLKVLISLKKLWEMVSINLAYVVPKFTKIWHIEFIGNFVK